MAKQCGVNLFVGTRYGCTGYILDGLPYIRRRSSLDGKQWKRSPAFAKSRAAAVVFGGASRLAAQVWKGVPSKLKKCMDAGAYNRLVAAVHATHLENAARYVHRAASGKSPAHCVRVVDRLDGGPLGRALNGLDLSLGHFLCGEMQGEGLQGEGTGAFFHLDRADRIAVGGLEGLLDLVPEGAAVRVRLHVARVEALPHHWEEVNGQYFREMGSAPECAGATSAWVVVSGADSCVELGFPGRITGAGDEDRWFLNFVGLEVGIRVGDGRWRRLEAACKAFVVCNAQGGEVQCETVARSFEGPVARIERRVARGARRARRDGSNWRRDGSNWRRDGSNWRRDASNWRRDGSNWRRDASNWRRDASRLYGGGRNASLGSRDASRLYGGEGRDGP